MKSERAFIPLAINRKVCHYCDMTPASLYQPTPRNPKTKVFELEPANDVRVDGDHDRLCHVIDVTEMAYSDDSRPRTSFCGKTWIPEGSGVKYSICQTCANIGQARFNETKQMVVF